MDLPEVGILSSPHPQGSPTLSPSQCRSLLAGARKLLQAARSGEPWRPLRGRNLGLLCELESSEGAALFRAACIELGARVAVIHPSLSWRDRPQEVAQTAQVLGRLYDAIECQGLAPALVQQLRANAGVPVFDGVALPGHASSALTPQLGEDWTPGECRRYLLEAAILDALVPLG